MATEGRAGGASARHKGRSVVTDLGSVWECDDDCTACADDDDYSVERIEMALAAVYKPEGVAIWMTAEHKQWGGWTVTEMLNHNRGDEVLAAIERLTTGAFG